MSSDRSTNNRPLKPSLASNRTARTPITPRVAGNVTPPTQSVGSRPTLTVRSEPSTPRAKQTRTTIKDVLANGNVTPRSSARASRGGSANVSPTQTDSASKGFRPKSSLVTSIPANERNGSVGELGSLNGTFNKDEPKKSKSQVSDSYSAKSPLVGSPGFFNMSPQPTGDTIDGKFFHANDAPKQEPKKSQFFHADGKHEDNNISPKARSPVLSALSEQRSPGPWIRSENGSHAPKSPRVQSPALNALSGVSPFFAPTTARLGRQPSPTSSKENIHLSYRKGASQIFGAQPSPTARSTVSNSDNLSGIGDQRSPLEPSQPAIARHHKSPSLSSIDSYSSLQAKRRSTTAGELEPSLIPLAEEINTAVAPHLSNPLQDLPSIDTSLESPGVLSRAESSLSPTKAGSELAAEARRERKVLDLEISNSSLMAINTSLEREVRRQKAELKRFRRLSRAGRFSFAPGERMRTLSEDLSALPEESEDEDYFGPHPGSADSNDDSSDDEEESVTSSVEPLGPVAQDRLAKDERRLRVDLEKHRELLSQSQAMNQSIKRCMYATEDMISEGKKALEYHVRVSDVKLGGRVLSNHEDVEESQEIEVEDHMVDNDDVERAKDFLEAWTEIGRPSLEGSEAGDRDSGIEADRPPHTSLPLVYKAGNASDSGRPPGLVDLGRFGSFS